MAADGAIKEQYIASLRAGAITFPRLVLGTLGPQALAVVTQARIDKGWPPRAGNSIEVRASDIVHQLKRLKEGLTADEMWRLVECVLHPNATARCQPNGTCIVLYFEQIELEPGFPFTPHGVVMDAVTWKAPRLYGLIPKGWAGRRK